MKLGQSIISYLKRLASLLRSPQTTWEEVANEHPTHSQCFWRIFAPMLLLLLITALLNQLFWSKTNNIESMVFQLINTAIMYVCGYYTVRYLTYKWLDYRCPEQFLSEDCEKVIAYGLTFMMMTDMLVLLAGNQYILLVFYVIIAMQYKYAFTSVIDCPEDKRTSLVTAFFILTILGPNLFRFILTLLLPNAPK